MKAQDYWKKRVLLAKQKEMESTAEYEVAMRSRLKDLENEFIKESKNWLSKYANSNNQSLKQAAHYLNSIDTSKFDMTLAEFEAKAKASGYEKELNSAYYKSRIARLKELYKQYQNLAASYADSEEANMALALAQRYQDTYLLENYNRYLVVGGIDVNLAHFNEQELKDIVYQPWKGSDFSKRIWNNYTKVMPEVLTDVMFRSIALGYSHTRVEQMLRDRFQGVVNSNIHRLVVTEMGHAAEQATAKFYEDSKIEQYEYLATLESHTCERCAHLDGRIFSTKNKVEGLNYPLIHPYCRCTTVPYIKGLPGITTRWSRDYISGKGRWIKNQLYAEWEKNRRLHILTANEWIQMQNISKLDVAKFLKLPYNVTGYLNKPPKSKDVPKTLQYINEVSISDYIDRRWNERPSSKPEDISTRNAVKANLIEQANKIAKLSVLPTVEIRMRVHTSDLESILDNGFKTQLETKSSGGAYNPSLRKEATAKLFNLSPKEMNNLKPNEFEKYGYLWDNRDKEPDYSVLDPYGSTKVIFKNEIRDRITYFHGDSLGLGKYSLNQELNRAAKLGEPNPSYLRSMWKFKADDGLNMGQKLWRDPNRKLSDDYTNINQFLKDPSKFYNEAQIHGSLTKKDIELIIISKEELTKTLQQKLKQDGIKYKVIGGNHDD